MKLCISRNGQSKYTKHIESSLICPETPMFSWGWKPASHVWLPKGRWFENISWMISVWKIPCLPMKSSSFDPKWGSRFEKSPWKFHCLSARKSHEITLFLLVSHDEFSSAPPWALISWTPTYARGSPHFDGWKSCWKPTRSSLAICRYTRYNPL